MEEKITEKISKFKKLTAINILLNNLILFNLTNATAKSQSYNVLIVSEISTEAILERSLRQIYQHIINASKWSDSIFQSIIFIKTNYLGMQKRNAFFFTKTLSSSVNSQTIYSQSFLQTRMLLKITNNVKFPTISREDLFILNHSREVKNISSEVAKIFLVFDQKSLRIE